MKNRKGLRIVQWPLRSNMVEAIPDAVKRASERRAGSVHTEMLRGLNTLAAIAMSAPFVGVLGTLLGIVYSFPGVVGEKWSIYAATMESLGESLLPTELGLLVALLAFCSLKYLLARIEQFDAEMREASYQLLRQLASKNC